MFSELGLFSNEELSNAKDYKYSGVDDSLLVKYFLRGIWNWMVEFLPMWLAPNVITFAGFLLEVISFALSAYISEWNSSTIPRWLCIFNGVCTLTYQCLDNLDGKQARRTGSSSALGQFFDHGCDAITGALELMKFAITAQMYSRSSLFFFILCMGIGFLLTTWEEYVTHKFYLGPINGADEGVFLLGITQIAIGIFPGLTDFVDNLVTKILFLIIFAITVIMIVNNVVAEVIREPSEKKKAIVSILPMIVSIIVFCLVFCFSKTDLSTFFIISSGLVLQYGGQLVIIAILVKRPASKVFNSTLAIMWIGALIPVFDQSVIQSETYWGLYFYIIIFLMVFHDIRVIYSFSVGIGIPVFSIKSHIKIPVDQIPNNDHEELVNEIHMDLKDVEEEVQPQ